MFVFVLVCFVIFIMGVICKKIVVRGGEGGVKYVCDVCFVDIIFIVSYLVVVIIL